MTKSFSLNDNNDIFINKNGFLSISEDIDAVKFVCENVAKTRLNEMIYRQGEGLPYLEAVFVANSNLERFRSELRDSLAAVVGVVRIISINFDSEKQTLMYEAVILTEYGRVTING